MLAELGVYINCCICLAIDEIYTVCAYPPYDPFIATITTPYSCGKEYIGKTKIALGTHLKEHQAATRNREVDHSRTCLGKTALSRIEWDIKTKAGKNRRHLTNLGVLHHDGRAPKDVLQYNIRARKSKCFFLCSSVEWIQMDCTRLTGRHQQTRRHRNPRMCKSCCTFWGCFIIMGSSYPILQPYYTPSTSYCKQTALGVQDITVHWSLWSSQVPTYITTYPQALRSVISHVMPDGSGHPIAFTSCTLSSSERNYSQIEEEVHSLIFSLQRFHQYLYIINLCLSPTISHLSP